MSKTTSSTTLTVSSVVSTPVIQPPVVDEFKPHSFLCLSPPASSSVPLPLSHLTPPLPTNEYIFPCKRPCSYVCTFVALSITDLPTSKFFFAGHYSFWQDTTMPNKYGVLTELPIIRFIVLFYTEYWPSAHMGALCKYS